MKLTKCALLVAFCVFAQSVAVNGDGHGNHKCEEGCHKHCGHNAKCCVETVTQCHPYCHDPTGFCVHDPDFCVDELVKVCSTVPNVVCEVEQVCEKVKKQVCKEVEDEKCFDKVDKVCKDVKDCKKVPVKKCDDVCEWKTECHHDKHGSVAFASAHTSGSESAAAFSSATSAKESASGSTNAHAEGYPSFAVSDVFAKLGRRLNGCKKVEVCYPKCEIVHEEKCENKPVCDDVVVKVCEPIVVEKCFDDFVDECKDVKKCDIVKTEKCEHEKNTVCKDEVTCGKYYCGEWHKCNPKCCEDVKVEKCVSLY